MESFNSFSSDQIVLTKRQTSMIMASMLLFCLFVFIVGFFLGKRAVIDDFSSKITQEALHDQIDFLLTTQSLESSQENQAVVEAEPIVEEQDTILVTQQKEPVTSVHIIQEKNSQNHALVADTITVRPQNFPILDATSSVEEQSSIKNVKNPQYAQLIGFGTKQAAQAFVNRLKKHNVPVILKTMISKSASGKQRTWYQAITPTYESTEELQAHITKIKRLEHIRGSDIKIVNVK